jgi:hypothetical protein
VILSALLNFIEFPRSGTVIGLQALRLIALRGELDRLWLVRDVELI